MCEHRHRAVCGGDLVADLFVILCEGRPAHLEERVRVVDDVAVLAPGLMDEVLRSDLIAARDRRK